MVTRAGLTAAVLAIAATVLPCVLLAGQQAASASASDVSGSVSAEQAKSPVSVAITDLSPRWASPGATITVRGWLTNSSGKWVSRPAVQLESSAAPLDGLAALEPYADGQGPVLSDVPGASWQYKAALPPGSSVPWSIRLHASNIGMTSFGVYPLAALAFNAVGTLDTSYSYLPYEPAKKGQGSASQPAPAKIAWTWPLIDKPLLDAPFSTPLQGDCRDSQAEDLAASLSSGGRLATLLSAAASGDAAGRDQVTWAVDPALLANVTALAGCKSSYPAGARAASQWLSAFRAAVKGQPLFVTPYADVDLAALVAEGHQADVNEAFLLGWTIASGILHHGVNPPGTSIAGSGAGQPATVTSVAGNPVTGFAWPAGGIAGFSTLETLPVNGISTVLTDSASLPQAPGTVVRSPDENGHLTVLLANDGLTQTLGSGGSTPGDTFGTEQLFLAETAELAAASPAQPIIVAPPQRWRPSAALASGLLSETATAPWLSPSSLSLVAAAKHVPEYQPPVKTGRLQTPFSPVVLRRLRSLDRQITDLQGIQAYPNANLWLGAATIESSAWDGSSAGNRTALLGTVESYFSKQVNSVEIIADRRVTLGGLKGSVPVSIYNKLDYAVQVKLKISADSGLHVSQSPGNLIMVPAHREQRVELHIQASQVGSASITLRLLSAANLALPAKTITMTVQATQLGVLAMIILAVALGVFLIASAARAVHRSRTASSGDTDARPATAEGEAEPNATQADTVEGERTELKAAGQPGL
jgi:hypothetical protein